MLEMALVENIQRENLDAIEIAISYQRLMDECSLTQDALSERVGKNRATIANYLRLLKLPADIQIAIIEKKLSMGHARALINVEDPKVQKSITQKVIKEELSVRQTEELVRIARSATNERNATKAQGLSFEHQKMRADLRLRLGRQVDLKTKDDGSGKVEIRFENDDDLRRLIEVLNA
jgi:ParB family chromosome partitioning protein